MKAIAVLHISKIKAIVAELSRLKGWNLKSLGGALRCIPAIVKEVEAIGKARKLTGAEKLQLAVELTLQIAPLPWWLPESFARPFLEAVINSVVDALKDRF